MPIRKAPIAVLLAALVAGFGRPTPILAQQLARVAMPQKTVELRYLPTERRQIATMHGAAQADGIRPSLRARSAIKGGAIGGIIGAIAGFLAVSAACNRCDDPAPVYAGTAIGLAVGVVVGAVVGAAR
ncbi:MAG: hypothetical protein WKF55_13070 [Gemmatimonadaceae bacterium]